MLSVVKTSYSAKVVNRSADPMFARDVAEMNGRGKAASFECGSFVRMTIRVGSGSIEDVGFRSNGCGYAVAAADLLAETMIGRPLTELNGLNTAETVALIEALLGDTGDLPVGRRQCVELAVDAFKGTLADHRRGLLVEFTGEKGLVCTCFSVTEEAIIDAIATNGAKSVAAVGEITNAGIGCGSCRMIIREILDGYSDGDI